MNSLAPKKDHPHSHLQKGIKKFRLIFALNTTFCLLERNATANKITKDIIKYTQLSSTFLLNYFSELLYPTYETLNMDNKNNILNGLF